MPVATPKPGAAGLCRRITTLCPAVPWEKVSIPTLIFLRHFRLAQICGV